MHPHIEYNALALANQGSWAKTDAAWERHRDWRAAWDAVKCEAKIDAEKEWERLMRHDVRLILRDDPDFPPHLKEIHASPFGLYVKGSFAFLPPAVAVVGTRRATREGVRIAHGFAEQLSRGGVAVISGLALGIDGAAHRGALAGKGRPTVAVLPCGLDRTYPAEHTTLAKEIAAAGGSVVSEYPLGSPPLPFRFLERNRIVSGLSLGTLVVEAPARSGALVTARLAMEQNRDVFVVPGPLTNPNYAGSHELIRQGACLVVSPGHIREALGLPDENRNAENGDAETDLSADERAVLSALRGAGTPLPLDSIAELGHLEAHAASAAASLLAVRGIITDMDGRYSL